MIKSQESLAQITLSKLEDFENELETQEKNKRRNNGRPTGNS